MKYILSCSLFVLCLITCAAAVDIPVADSGETVARIPYAKPTDGRNAGSEFLLTVRWPNALIQDLEARKLLIHDLAANKPVKTLAFPEGRFMISFCPDGKTYLLGEHSILAFDDAETAMGYMERKAGTPRTIPLGGLSVALPGLQYRFAVGPTGNFFIHDRPAQTLYVCGPDGQLINSYPCPVTFVPMPDGGFTMALDQDAQGILIEETPVAPRSEMSEQRESPGTSRRVMLDPGVPNLIGMQPDGTALLLMYPPMPGEPDANEPEDGISYGKLYLGSDSSDIRMTVLRVDGTGHASPFLSLPIGEWDGTFDVATGSLWFVRPSGVSETAMSGLEISRKPL
ncbi:MAG TPA: hypothetical protein PLP29_08005 [Candidatus Ozemobacteraceae bacterium]|nr:hypothetical protein [Candidatus Ozemobacteraceae bacterium]